MFVNLNRGNDTLRVHCDRVDKSNDNTRGEHNHTEECALASVVTVRRVHDRPQSHCDHLCPTHRISIISSPQL